MGNKKWVDLEGILNKESDSRSTYARLTLMDLLPEPRVGDMRDFFGEMSPKERRHGMQLIVLSKCIRII